jgi:hypothetical protein
MALDGTLPAYWQTNQTSFTLTNALKAKIIIDVSPAKVVAEISGETALPGESSIRQRVLMGGQRVVDGLISSTDAAAKSMLFYIGKQLSLYASMGVVTTTATANATVTRTVGSFITDGWTIGDSLMLYGSLSYANDGVLAQITSVTATALTLNGIAGVSVAETQGAGFRVIKVAQATRIPIPANAGNTDAIFPVRLFGHINDARQDSGIYLGTDSVLIMGMVASLSALPASIGVTTHAGLY